MSDKREKDYLEWWRASHCRTDDCAKPFGYRVWCHQQARIAELEAKMVTDEQVEPTEEMVERGCNVIKGHRNCEPGFLFEYKPNLFRRFTDRELAAEIYRVMRRAALQDGE